MSGELGRVVKFCVVGVSNTVLTVAVYVALTHAGVPAAAASALAFAAGAVNGYRLNRAWTFRAASAGWQTLARYVMVQGLGAALSAAGVGLAGSDLELRHLVAEIVVLPFVTLTTYTLSRLLVFGAPEPA
jgi:putative flippase GtrA